MNYSQSLKWATLGCWITVILAAHRPAVSTQSPVLIANQSQAPMTQPWTTYILPGTFSIEYPQGWLVTQEKPYGTTRFIVTFLNQQFPADSSGLLLESMIKTDLLLQKTSFLTTIRDVDREWENRKVVRQRHLKLSERQAYQVWSQMIDDNGLDVDVLTTVIQLNPCETVILSSFYNHRSNPAAATIVENLHNSFRAR